jgi:hypothetical protein
MPGGAGAQHPEHAVEYGAGIRPRTPPTVGTATGTERRFEHAPLGVGEVHAVEYDGDRNFVHNPESGFVR